VVPLILLGGDVVFTFGGIVLAWWLRYQSALGRFGIYVPNAQFTRYLSLLLLGVALLIAAFAQFGLYDSRLILRRYQGLNAILKGSAFWLAAYLGISLVLKFDPPISRLFVLMAFVCVCVFLYLWRVAIYTLITRSTLVTQLRRRATLLGWNEQAASLAQAIARDTSHPFQLNGFVATPGTSDPTNSETSATLPRLGSLADLNQILTQIPTDVLIVVQPDLPQAELRRTMEICERRYVEWKVIPGAFEILLSGLRLQTIGRIPVLGIEALAIDRLLNRALKRSLDVVGAIVGIAISVPVIAVLAILIKRESPGGPIFFRQRRVGVGHRSFTLWKLRSMSPDAEQTDRDRQSTARADARVLRVGTFMRRWNLDELPQFWNVLCGDMSLVGPRPERPYHVEQLAETIPHYLPRHIVKPGMTGWAQVNGLRGDTSVADRIQHDIYYIENWSIWLDIQIMLLTFVRWQNAY
jgi:exopolysaccharide biosynthesis polyprenyl glycosylphosphotransferase